MEVKKAPSADLEKDKFLSLTLGLLVSIAVVFVALEWRNSRGTSVIKDSLSQLDIEDTMIIPEQEQQEETPPPAETVTQPEIQLPEEFKVVDNSQKVDLKIVSVDEGKPLPPPNIPAGPATPVVEQVEEVVELPDEQAEFPGGADAMNSFLSKNLKYPEVALENGIQGRVIVQFVIEKDGRPTGIKIGRSVDPLLDKEAERLVKSMPKWKPGMQGGKVVRSRFTLPVVFRIQ